MRPVFQTRFPEFDGGRGNCLAASLASLLEVPLAEVPAFEDLPKGAWRVAVASWLAERGLSWRVHYRPPPGWAIAVGPARNGRWRHAFVVRDGECAHDPFPGSNGVEATEFWVFDAAAQLSEAA